MEILQKKEQMAAITFIVVLLTSTFILLTTVTVYAQDETPHGGEPSGTGLGISGPLPPGETPSVYIDTSAHLSARIYTLKYLFKN